MTTIIIKNSSTSSAVPVSGDLTKGELAVNVTDKKLYTKDNGGSVVKLVGGLGNQEASAVAITGGAIDGTPIGGTTASTASFTTLSASGNVTLSGGTANGVLYLNGSKVATSGSALTFDGTNFATTGTITSGGSYNFNTTSGRDILWGTSSYTYITGNPGTGVMAFGIANSELMRLTSTGLGIGTSSPGAKLEVASANSLGSFATIRLNSPYYQYWDLVNDSGFSFKRGSTEFLRIDASGNLGLGVTPSASSACVNMELSSYGATLSARNTSSAPQFAFMSNAVGNWYAPTYKINGKAAMYLAQGNDGSHSWYTAGTGTAGNAITFTQAMTLDASGSLAVGGTTVVTNNGGITATTTSSGSIATTLAMRNAGTANGSGSQLAFRGVTNAGSENDYGYLTMVANDTTAKSSYMGFWTSNSGTLGERARIDSSGNLLVGTTTAAGIVSVEQRGNTGVGSICSAYNHFHAGTKYADFLWYGSSIGSITNVSGTAVAYNTTSDYRLKNIDGPLTGSGAFIDALKPKVGTWKSNGSKFVGFIAHEVQEVSPGSVVGEKDGEQMQAMEYGSAEFIANIIAELQSLRARVAALES